MEIGFVRGAGSASSGVRSSFSKNSLVTSWVRQNSASSFPLICGGTCEGSVSFFFTTGVLRSAFARLPRGSGSICSGVRSSFSKNSLVTSWVRQNSASSFPLICGGTCEGSVSFCFLSTILSLALVTSSTLLSACCFPSFSFLTDDYLRPSYLQHFLTTFLFFRHQPHCDHHYFISSPCVASIGTQEKLSVNWCRNPAATP